AHMTADSYEKAGGLLRFDDLSGFQAHQAEPVHMAYKGYDIYAAAPNSQGAVLLIALNIVDGFDLKSMGFNSPAYLHVVTEAMKLAFADRDQYIADPRFTDVPVDGLLSPRYAAARRELIRQDQAIRGMAPAGDPRHGGALLPGSHIVYEDE